MADLDISGVALPSGPDGKKRRVCYFYEPTIGDYYYGQGHPMKPHRIRMAHNLIVHYSLHRLMEIHRPFPASPDDISRFHSSDYVEFLASVTPQMQTDAATHGRHLKRFNVGEDCPVFDGLFNFCQASAGGSIGAAVKINRGDADIAVNWAGGLHHAKKCEASGFCYVNDIVLGILELLKVHRMIWSIVSGENEKDWKQERDDLSLSIDEEEDLWTAQILLPKHRLKNRRRPESFRLQQCRGSGTLQKADHRELQRVAARRKRTQALFLNCCRADLAEPHLGSESQKRLSDLGDQRWAIIESQRSQKTADRGSVIATLCRKR
ncbi:hypothetical protein MRB53_023526 [Persea americana]|uniref:Uncharacterized protein n=1 Tax=Persea americana TaxID=3435 RepID=A0ACC2LA72_PERAE|nr:hypothetical protein MRB53_023526 [Persea americana]